MNDGMESLERVRAICFGLPEVTERLSHGEAAWFVRDKRQFASFADHHHDDRVAVWCAAHSLLRDELVAADPERFFVPPYVGTRGWLGISFEGEVDWDEVGGL